jgi:hypothetical protein
MWRMLVDYQQRNDRLEFFVDRAATTLATVRELEPQSLAA